MARGIVRAADRVAVWHSAADMWPTGPDGEMEDHATSEPSAPPPGAEQKPIPKSNKFTIPANGLKKTVENHTWHPDEAASKGQKPHTDIGLKNWFDAKPDFAKTYMKPHYQDALKSHLGDENYDKLKYHMPKEHHDALHTHQQAAPPKSNKFTTPANGLKKLLDQPHTETSHVSDWLAKHPGFQKTYMSPKYTDALKGHLGDKAYNELQEHLKAAQEPAESQLYATPPKKPTKNNELTHYDKTVSALGQEHHTPEFQQWFYKHDLPSQANLAMMPESALQWYQEDQAKKPDKGLGDKLAPHLPHLNVDSWNDVGATDPEGAKSSLDSLIKAIGHGDPETAEKLKTIHKEHFGEDDQKSDFHPALKELSDLTGTQWGDSWKGKDSKTTHDQLKSWQDTFKEGQPETAQAIQRVLDKHFGDQDEIDNIKGQQPQKSFGHAVQEAFPDKFTDAQVESVNNKTPEEQKKLLQNTINGKPETWDNLNKIHNDFFGENAYNPHPAKEELAQQMAENHGSNYEYDSWIGGLDNDDLKYYQEHPNAAKGAFDNYIDESNYDEDYDDPDDHSDEFYDEDPESDPESDDYDPYTDPNYGDDEDEVNDDPAVQYSPVSFLQEVQKAYPGTTLTHEKISTPDQAKNFLRGIIDEPEEEGLGDKDNREEYANADEYEEHYDQWMADKLKAQQLYDKYFGDGGEEQVTGDHAKAMQIAKGIQALDPGTFDDHWVQNWADENTTPDQWKKTLNNLIESDWNPEETAGYKALLQKHFGEGGQQQGPMWDNISGVTGIGKSVLKAQGYPIDQPWKPEELKELMSQYSDSPTISSHLQKLYDEHFGESTDPHNLSIPEVMALPGNTRQNIQNWLQSKNGKGWAEQYLNPKMKDMHWGNQPWADKLVSHLPDEYKAQMGVQSQSLGQKMQAINPAINAETFDKQSPEGQKDILQNVWAKHDYFGPAMQQLYDEHYGDADEINNIKQTHDPVQLAKELAPLVNNQDYQTMHQSGKKWIDKTPEEAKADLQQLIGIYDDKAPQLQALYDKYFGGQQQDLSSDEFSQWANDFDNKAPVNSWQNSADQWQNLANGIDEIFPKNKLPMSSMSVDDLKQKLEGWLEHLKDTPGHADNVAKLQALYDQNFGQGSDIDAIKSQMPDKYQDLLDKINVIKPGWIKKKTWLEAQDKDNNLQSAVKGWAQHPDLSPEEKAGFQKLHDQHFGGGGQQEAQGDPNAHKDPEFLGYMGNAYGLNSQQVNDIAAQSGPGGKYEQQGNIQSYLDDFNDNTNANLKWGPASQPPQSHVDHSQILDAFGEPSEDFMQWFAKDNGWKWGENPAQDKDLLQMLHDPDNHWTQQKVNKYLKDQVDWGDKKDQSSQYDSGPLYEDLKKIWPNASFGKHFGESPEGDKKILENLIQGWQSKPELKDLLQKHFGGDDQDEISQIKKHIPGQSYYPQLLEQGAHGLSPQEKDILHHPDFQKWFEDQPPEDQKQAYEWPVDMVENFLNQTPGWKGSQQGSGVEASQHAPEDMVAGDGTYTPLALKYLEQSGWSKEEDSGHSKWGPDSWNIVTDHGKSVIGEKGENYNKGWEQFKQENGEGQGDKPDLMGTIAKTFPNMAQGTKNKWLKMSPEQQKVMVAQHASGKGIGGGKMTMATTKKWKGIYDALYGDQAQQQSGGYNEQDLVDSLQEILPDLYGDDAGFIDQVKGKNEKWQKSNLKALINQGEKQEVHMLPKLKALYDKHFGEGVPGSGQKQGWDFSATPSKQQFLNWGLTPSAAETLSGLTPEKFQLAYEDVKTLQEQMGAAFENPGNYGPDHPWNKILKGVEAAGGVAQPSSHDPEMPTLSWIKEHHPSAPFGDSEEKIAQWWNGEYPGYGSGKGSATGQNWIDDYYGDKDKHLGQSGNSTSEPSGPPEFDPQSFADQYKEILPGSSSSLASGTVDPQKAFTKLTDLISAHPDSDKTPKLQEMLDHWFPDGAPESQATVDPAQKKKTTLPAGSAHYKALMKNVMNKPQGAYSENDLKTFRSKKFKDWFDAAPPGYQKTLATNPGIVIDDFDNGNYSAPVGGGEWGDSSTHKNQYYDVMGYPKTKKNDDLPEHLRQNPSRPGGEGIKFPRHEDEQETLPLSPGEHFAPHYAPMPIYRLFPIELDKEPKVPGWVKGEKNQKLFVEQQKARLRRIDEIINGTHKARNTSSDTSSFNQWTKSIGLSNQDKTDLYNSLFAPVNDQPTLFDDDRWKLFEDKAKELGIAPEKLADLAENLDVTPGTPPKGNYDHPDLAELILDYAQGYRGHTGRGGLGTHWTRDKHKVYEGVGGVQSASPSSSRNLTVGISGLWSGQGEGTGSHGAFDPMDDSEREHNLEAGAPVWIRRLQIKDPNAAWHDLVDHGPISTWTPGRDETASGKTVRDKPSLAEELTKAIGGTHDAEVFDKLKPGHKAEMLMGKIWKDNPTKRPQVEALYRDFFVGRPDLPTKPHKRSASLQRARQTPKEIEARIIELEMSM